MSEHLGHSGSWDFIEQLNRVVDRYEGVLGEISAAATVKVAQDVVLALPRALDRRLAVGVGIAGLLLMLVAFSSGYFCGVERAVIGIRWGADHCDMTKAGLVCYIPVLIPAKPPGA